MYVVYGRVVGRANADVMTKFSGIVGFPISIAVRAPPRAPEVRYKFSSKKKQFGFIACLKRSYNVCVI